MKEEEEEEEEKEFTFPNVAAEPHLHRNYQRSRSFSFLEDLKLREEEEKMDMLWEDFNDELRQVSGDGGSSRQLFCLKDVRKQRPGFVMVLKVLKKMISAQRSRKKRTAASVYLM